MKIFITLLLLNGFLAFGQSDVPSQSKYLKKKTFEKYFVETISTIVDYFNADLDNYKDYLSREQKSQNLSLEAHGIKCSKACPDNFDILKVNSDNFEQKMENSLSFVNLAHNFSKIMKIDYGVCWGHASITNLFRQLAFFDPDNKYLKLKFKKGDSTWNYYIRKAMRNVFNNKPAFFPYIKSLKDLSEEFENIMKKLVIEKWADNAISLENYIQTYNNNIQYSQSELFNFVNELESRLRLGQTPEVIFQIKESETWIHVVLIKEIIESKFDHTYTLLLDDNKQFNNISNLYDFRSKITLNLLTGEIIYNNGRKFGAPSNKIGRIMSTFEGYKMYDKALPRLQKFCERHSGCIK